MYLDDLAAKIRANVPSEQIPAGDSDQLFRMYAILLRAKGTSVTLSDIHDAWSAWMISLDGEHESLVAFENLPKDVQEEDRVFATAVKLAAEQSSHQTAARQSFAEILFPSGPPKSADERSQTLNRPGNPGGSLV